MLISFTVHPRGAPDLVEALENALLEIFDMWGVQRIPQASQALATVSFEVGSTGFEVHAHDVEPAVEAALTHWFSLAAHVAWSDLRQMAEEHEVELDAAPPPIAPRGFVVNGGVIEAAPGEEDGPCPVCEMAQPSDRFAGAMIAHVNQNRSALDSVGWYVRHMVKPPVSLLEALAEAIEEAPQHSRTVLDAIANVAPRIEAPDRGTVGGRAMFLAWSAGRHEVQGEHIKASLQDPAPACGMAAELAGLELREERDEVAPDLLRVLDHPIEEMRHRAMLGLINLYLGPKGARPEVPAQVLAAFEAHADPNADGPSAGRLAAWAVQVFMRPQ